MTRPRQLSRFEVLDLLRRRIEKAGSLRAWARTHCVSPAYVSDTLNGRRDPGPAILVPLGLERIAKESQRYQKQNAV